jgi:hypothetical protein
LATIQFKDLYTGFGGKKYKCCGCIINSDVYQGGGKHWMALFADARGSKWTVEFFNSSGNSPGPEWISWLVKTKNQMEELIDNLKLKNNTVEILKVCNIRHQQSRTECGVYSLFYLWARLNGLSYEYFMKKPVPDQLMMEFRQHLFNDPERKISGRFDFAEYKKMVKIEWE